MFQKTVTVSTTKRELINITAIIEDLVTNSNVTTGLCHVFIHHTSASLIINENADPSVQTDLQNFMARLIPDGDPLFTHIAEGPDDMPSHLRTVFTQTSLTIPIMANTLGLGTWQGIFLWEHRTIPHQRKITITIAGS